METRQRATSYIIWIGALVLFALLTGRFHRLGGPFFSRPETIYDHVWATRHPTADAVVAIRGAKPFLPAGASVTVLRPSILPAVEVPDFATAVGLLPEQVVIPAGAVEMRKPQYVIAIGAAFRHPRYLLVASYRGGHLYRGRMSR